MNPDYLAYALVDAVIDEYYLIMENPGGKIEHIEDVMVSNPAREKPGGHSRAEAQTGEYAPGRVAPEKSYRRWIVIFFNANTGNNFLRNPVSV